MQYRLPPKRAGLALLFVLSSAASAAFALPVLAQEEIPASGATGTRATSTFTYSTSSDPGAATTTIGGIQFERSDLTRPEEIRERQDLLHLLEQRPIERPGFLSFLAWWVQEAVKLGVPANTIVLILLIPILAMIVTFVRTIIGLPSLEMLTPIILAFAFVAVGITVGLLILAAIVAASFFSRRLLRSAPLMHYPKRSLSLLLLAFFVFAALTAGIGLNIERIGELSIFPVLILTLLGDSIVSLQLHKTIRDTLIITVVTIVLGVIGYVLATMVVVRDLLILYPEVVLLTIPVNVVMGRYFGLRLSEVLRFRTFQTYGSE